MAQVRWCVGLLVMLMLTVLLGSRAAVAAPQATVLSAGQLSARVSGVEFLIEAHDQPLSVREVLAAPVSAAGAEAAPGGWTLYTGKKVNLSRLSTPVWLRMEIDNQTVRGDWVLGIDWPLLGDVRFHQLDDAGRVISFSQTGLLSPPEAKLNDPGYVFPLQLAPGQKAQVLIRVATTSSTIVPLTVWGREAYQTSRNTHALLMGLLFGILSIMLLYNASLFVFTGDRSYAWYSLYLLAATLYELSITGYGPLLVWGDNRWLTERGYELFACLTFLSATLFFRTLLNIPRCGVAHLRWLNTAFIGFWSLTVVMTALQPSRGLSVSIALIGLLSGGAAVYTSVVLMLRGNRVARYFALAWGSLLVGTIAHILSLMNVLEGNWLTDYGQHVGFVIEICLLSLALADRIRRDRLARDRAQEEALKLTRSVQLEREQKIRAQEEVIALQSIAKQELEARVLDRTAELQRAMTNLELANIELAKLSVTDALTKVHNRRYFDEALQREHDRSSRTQVPLALMLADIDHFKRINDSVGHLAGDECLRLVASALSQTVGRSTDLVARYGGEEFALVLPGTGPEQATEVAERVRLAVQSISFIYRGKRVPLTVSVGVVSRVAPVGGAVADFVAEADAALYRAKGEGRNRVMLAA